MAAESGTVVPAAGMPERAFPVRRREDVMVAANEAQRLALLFGLSKRRAGELAIVVAELGTNIVKYGVRGEIGISFDTIDDGGVQVVARDVGPPFKDLEMAKTDGCNDRGPIDPAHNFGRGGLGTGLGAVLRLADGFDCRQDDAGKEITIRFDRESASSRRRP